jgi:PAS domain S-box-containing protein
VSLAGRSCLFGREYHVAPKTLDTLRGEALENSFNGGRHFDLAARIESHDWENTPLGPISAWPACLRAAVDLMLPAQAEIVLFWGDDFIALYNDAYAPTIGDKHPHALGRPAREHWSELWSDLEPLLRRVYDKGETVVAKNRPFYIERFGYPETVYFDISYSPMRDETGRVRGVFCIVAETTARVRADHALRESEDRFRTIFSQTASGMAQVDLEGRFLLVNQRFCDLIGYSEAELLQMRMQEVTFFDDLPETQRLLDLLVSHGENFEFEKRYSRKDGSLVWVTASVSPLRNHEGRIVAASAIIIDISERKRAQEVERQLAAIIASSDDAILSTGLDMTIASWNLGAEKLYGYTAEEAIGRSVMMLVPEERKEEEPGIISRIRAGQKVEPFETQRLRRDGTLVDVLLSVSPVYDAHGRIVGASKIAHDISSRKEAERLQTMLIDELNHRVKNLLATVIAIARQTFGREEANRRASEVFEARLGSLARAHNLLTRGHWEQAGLRAVVEQALSPYPADKLDIEGPDVQLTPKAVVSLSLALHELATNAAKYGALSANEGRVGVAWTYNPGKPARLRLVWRETDGPPVAPPTRKGFGSRLIEMLLANELKGDVALRYEPQGVVCEVTAIADPAWDPNLDEPQASGHGTTARQDRSQI